MKVRIFLEYSFPASSASSNRYFALAKGLEFRGWDVEIVSVFPTRLSKTESHLSELTGKYEGIKYRQLSETQFLKGNFLKRNIIRFKGALRLFLYTAGLKQTEIAMLSVRMPFINILLIPFLKMKGIKCVIETSEFPQTFRYNFKGKVRYFLFRYIILPFRLIDGLAPMTWVLKEYYDSITRGSVRAVVFPMSVDVDRFEEKENETKENYEFKYITYCGDLGSKRDGVGILIRAFSKILKQHPDYKLQLIGGYSNKKIYDEYLKIIMSEGIDDSVIFTGKLSRDEMPEHLLSSSILALARPSSLQSAGGFPTKLGEYLATKKPVVVTDTGEIRRYLVDKVSAFIAKPDSVEDFAKKLFECIENPELSEKIGLKGYETAIENFDFRNQSKILDGFFKELIKRDKSE